MAITFEGRSFDDKTDFGALARNVAGGIEQGSTGHEYYNGLAWVDALRTALAPEPALVAKLDDGFRALLDSDAPADLEAAISHLGQYDQDTLRRRLPAIVKRHEAVLAAAKPTQIFSYGSVLELALSTLGFLDAPVDDELARILVAHLPDSLVPAVVLLAARDPGLFVSRARDLFGGEGAAGSLELALGRLPPDDAEAVLAKLASGADAAEKQRLARVARDVSAPGVPLPDDRLKRAGVI